MGSKVVGEVHYPNCVIQFCLVMGLLFHQPLRQTTGLVSSILLLLGRAYLPVPNFSTLCRRQGSLAASLGQAFSSGKKINLAIDSTGLKVYGEGEWKVRKHGAGKRRTWRKLHVGIDLDTQQIVCMKLSSNAEDDAAVAQELVKGKTDQLKSFRGDGAYDDFKFREALGLQVKQIIPPPKDAVVRKASKKKPVPAFLQERNQVVEYMQAHGREAWKEESGYHKRSLNEVAMFRFKTCFTAQLRAHKLEHQQTEALLKCVILNRHTKLGMPRSYKVE